MKASPIRRTRRKSTGQPRAFFRHSPDASFFAPAEAAVQRKENATSAASNAVANHYVHTLPGRGEPLSDSVQSFFRSQLDADFSDVRIHHDASAAESAAALHAQAYTTGENIVFNRDKYAPETTEGRKLLGHELVHVLQQRRSPRGLQAKPEEGKSPGPGEKKDEKKESAQAPIAEDKAGESAAKSPEAADQEKAADAQGAKAAEPMPLPDFATFGKPTKHTDFGKSVTFNGKTDATFDGGVGQTKNLKAVPATDCAACAANECVQVTGSLVINYHVSTTVTLPDVPAGLTPCQEKRVSEAINGKIKPHEDQHVAAFSAYNGTVTLPINYHGCKAGLADHVQAMHDSHALAREAAAKAQSAALDPFNVSVNLDCEDEPPPKK